MIVQSWNQAILHVVRLSRDMFQRDYQSTFSIVSYKLWMPKSRLFWGAKLTGHLTELSYWVKPRVHVVGDEGCYLMVAYH